MNSTKESYDEMNLAEILRELYRWKWLLFALTLAAGVAAAAVTLAIPNVYESSAALIIQEPQRVIYRDRDATDRASETPALSVETVQTLTESTEIKWTLFEGLWEERALDEWKNGSSDDKLQAFTGFQASLSTEVKARRDRASDVALLPILVLKARARSPVDAQTIANAWASLVEAESRKIYTDGVTALGTFTSGMYAKSIADLGKYEQDLAEKTIEAALDLKKVRLDAVKDKCTGLEEDIFDLETEVVVNDAAIKEGRRRIVEQQHEREWIGSVVEGAAMKAESFPFDKESLSPRALEIVELVLQEVKQAESLRAYRKQENLIAKQKEFDHYQLEVARILTEKAKVDDELPSVQAALGALSEQMKTIPEKITLKKAITDDPLFEAYLSGDLPKTETLDPLQTEILNPLYQWTAGSAVDLITKIETLKGSSEQLTKSADAAAQSIADLESEIDTTQRETDRLEQELEATEEVLALLREDYVAEMKRVEELVVENARKQEELDTKEELRKTIAQGMSALEEDVSNYQLEIEVLTREVEKTKGVQTALASKAEEAALLQVSAEKASRTGTAILYKAQANPLKVAPARSKIVLASMLGAFLLCCLLVFSAKTIRASS